MPTVSRAVIIELPRRAGYLEVFWPISVISMILLSGYLMGWILAVILVPIWVTPWVIYELTYRAGGQTLIAWWKGQVHLYECGQIKRSVRVGHIKSLRWFSKSFLGVSLPWYGELFIATKTDNIFCPFGPLPYSIIKRLKKFSLELDAKREQVIAENTAPEIDFE